MMDNTFPPLGIDVSKVTLDVRLLSQHDLTNIDPNARVAEDEVAAFEADAGYVEAVQVVAAYAESERWAREVLAERAPAPGWTRDFTVVLAAAFDAYQRGAVDYEP